MYELKVVRERRQGYGTLRRVRDASQIHEAFREKFGCLDRETFVAVLLDGKNQVLGFNVVSVGSLTAALVHPRLCVATHNRERSSSPRSSATPPP